MAALSKQSPHGVRLGGVSSTAISTTLAHWFDFRRGLALSLALTGASVGGFAVAPVLLTLSQRHGLAAAMPEVVLSLLAVIVPLIWIGIRWQADRRPLPLVAATVGPTPPIIASRSKVLQDAQFWSVAAPFALALSAQVGTIVIQVSYLLPLLGTRGTSIALVCTSVAGVVGRFGLRSGDRPLASAGSQRRGLRQSGRGTRIDDRLPGLSSGTLPGERHIRLGYRQRRDTAVCNHPARVYPDGIRRGAWVVNGDRTDCVFIDPACAWSGPRSVRRIWGRAGRVHRAATCGRSAGKTARRRTACKAAFGKRSRRTLTQG